MTERKISPSPYKDWYALRDSMTLDDAYVNTAFFRTAIQVHTATGWNVPISGLQLVAIDEERCRASGVKFTSFVGGYMLELGLYSRVCMLELVRELPSFALALSRQNEHSPLRQSLADGCSWVIDYFQQETVDKDPSKGITLRTELLAKKDVLLNICDQCLNILDSN